MPFDESGSGWGGGGGSGRGVEVFIGTPEIESFKVAEWITVRFPGSFEPLVMVFQFEGEEPVRVFGSGFPLGSSWKSFGVELAKEFELKELYVAFTTSGKLLRVEPMKLYGL